MNITQIIARLGHACGLPWARCSSTPVLTRFWPCIKARGHGGLHYDGEYERSPTTSPIVPLPPTIAEWATEWEREHPGEPGPVACWHSPEKRSDWVPYVAWYVDAYIVRIRVGTIAVDRWNDRGWGLRADGVSEIPTDAAMTIELGRLMKAVDGAQ